MRLVLVYGLGSLLLALQIQGATISLPAVESAQDVTAVLAVLSPSYGVDTVEEAASADHLFAPLTTPDVHFGYTGDAYWFRLALESPGVASLHILELNNAQLSSVTLYTPADDGTFQSQVAGVDVPFIERPVLALTPSFLLRLAPGEQQTCYLRVEHYGALRFSATLSPEREGRWHASLTTVLNAMLAGALLGLAVYNGFVFAGLRQPTYLWIALMLLGMALNQMTFSGVANLLLWSGPGRWADHAFTLTGVLVISFGIAASMSFLKALRNTPSIARLAVCWIVFGLGAGLASLAGYPSVFYGVVAYLLGTPVLVAAMALRSIRRKSVTVLLFFGSWGIMMLGCVLFGLAYLDVVPDNALTLNFMYVAALGAAVTWSFALTRQVKSQAVRREARLEHKVAVRTVELESALGDVRALRGLLPTCGVCQRVRGEDGAWHVVDFRVAAFAPPAETCPDCAARKQRGPVTVRDSSNS